MWTRIQDGIPPVKENIGEPVLCLTQTGLMRVGWTIFDRWYLGNGYADEQGYSVTHWMPLPEPPTE